MKKYLPLLVLLHLALASATKHRPMYKWASPNPNHTSGPNLLKRDEGYEPEFGECGEGADTCSNACGGGFKECNSSENDAVFCYNPDEGESCCKDGRGSKFLSHVYISSYMYPLPPVIIPGSGPTDNGRFLTCWLLSSGVWCRV